ncbi:hypothetical protein [Actinopolymorpha rutila]|uniref:Uncharacterized protein n=1 Tax=Actinopolymorpha rutila TaxID=446787 RepID=A0A852ZIZ7_9ACTN|nr:hypothetical protein [Actinopolymorpha rutila]NYH92934.1 hypothetical protein [Actinopolymorpha rutila]
MGELPLQGSGQEDPAVTLRPCVRVSGEAGPQLIHWRINLRDVESERARVVERWPMLGRQLREALVNDAEHELAAQVDALQVYEMCPCQDDFCQSFYTAPPPNGAFGAGHRNVALKPAWSGLLILDVVDEMIMFVEVLYRSPLD